MGNLTVRIKDFDGPTTEYFGDRKRVFSIQVQGRFRKPMLVEDVFFGAVFDQKVSPPYLAYPAFKIAQVIDPSLQLDLTAEKPWLLSPAFCAMNTIQVDAAKTALDQVDIKPASLPLSEAKLAYPVESWLGPWTWGGEAELKEDISQMFKGDVLPFPADSYTDRRKYFGEADNRKVKISPDKIYNMDIFAPLYVYLG
jgi:hypothetical protein